jgi:tryptophan synthase beta chain
MIMNETKILLKDKELPKYFLNINYYLKKYLGQLPDPPLNPATKQPIRAKDLAAIFPMELIRQEVSLKKKIKIPEELRDIYKTYRSTPLFRAKNLEKFLQTPAHIYYKYEGNNPGGSHKLNTALAQAYYNKKEGVRKLLTETGAGQWGTALSMACKFFHLQCEIFMVKVSFEQKPYRRILMEMFGGKVHSSPSLYTEYGRKISKQHPDSPGSLGIAISEALEIVLKEKNAKYALGSVLDHVLLHQTIIGQEAKKQMEKFGEYPDIVIGCCGGGSNFAGLAFPFLADQLEGKRKIRFIMVEPKACPSFTKGKYRYDFGDASGKTPLLKMKTLGSNFIPDPIHAGGLRYHGKAPVLSFLYEKKLVEARAYAQLEVFKSGIDFARIEGIVPAPESSHAIKAAIDEAIKCKKEGIKKVIVFNLSGHGLLDLKGYDDYLHHKLT